MARSKSIWIIFDKKDREVVSAFTVKHEMVSWVQKHDPLRHFNRKYWQLYKVEDGQWQPAYGTRFQVDFETLVKGED